MTPLRIAILLDDIRIPLWVKEVLDALSEDAGVDLLLFIVNRATAPQNHRLHSLPYRALRFLDNRLFNISRDPFLRFSLPVPDSKILHVQPLQSRYSDRFPDDVTAKIRAEKIDIILRFGFRILRGEILTASRYGVLSLHHGSTRNYRGGPPAFWEVVNKEPVTTVTLQQLTEELDGGQIIGEAHLRTDRISFFRNQAKLYWAGKELLLSSIQEMAEKGPEVFFKEIAGKNKIPAFYSHRLYKNPGASGSLKIFFVWSGFNFRRKVSDLFFVNQWQILFSLKKGIDQSFRRFKSIKPPADRIWADPFIIYRDGCYHLFFEEKEFNFPKAHISIIKLSDKGDMISSPQVALKENFHLSYPFVFEHQGQMYMIPESAESGELYLYHSEAFPLGWKKIKTLISGLKVYDATLHLHEGVWYLFCSAKESDQLSSDAYLHIFYSRDFLNQPFAPHPMNPVYRDVRCSRPAGKLFEHDGRLIRPAQICAPAYGSGIVLHEIIELTTESFLENQIDQLVPNWDKNIKAMHAINRAGNMTVVDIQKRKFRWS